ncbi:hypothetical protein MW290_03485 [Aquincola tertiaricarbonis]|uniref:Uncharacterized protein n=1 Tax=Aquincola tertiaricarbonis TaxID=391953 RepID=A0ABY4S724_AQUTE|nr:hypothetical protein [Aquincola tertiaricarbonis]URI07692.1 hypothetical protein MW290_03485 [Aquincola tertiaricarbonis]
MKDVQGINNVADMEVWVQAHGYPRFLEAMVAGEFKGHTLRVARQWDIERSERRKRRLVMGLLALLVTGVLAALVIYIAPILLTSARQ